MASPAASNFPEHRGTATAFPLAAFGLSALFWSTVSTLIFKDNTGSFLLLLALGTSILSFVSTPFIRILPSESYASVPLEQNYPVEFRRNRRTNTLSSVPEESDDSGAQSSSGYDQENVVHARRQSVASNSRTQGHNNETDETSSLVSKGEIRPSFDTLDDDFLDEVDLESPHPDIRGVAMLRTVEFWQLWLTMALLSGIGLMTIKYVLP